MITHTKLFLAGVTASKRGRKNSWCILTPDIYLHISEINIKIQNVIIKLNRNEHRRN